MSATSLAVRGRRPAPPACCDGTLLDMANRGPHEGGWLEGLRARWEELRRRYRRRGPRVPTRPVTVVPYLGYGVPDRIVLRGRVLEGRVARRAGEADGPLRNLRNAFLRFETDELPGATCLLYTSDAADE